MMASIEVPRDDLQIVVAAMEAVIEFMVQVDYRWPSDQQFEVLQESTEQLRRILGPLPEYRPTQIPEAFRRAFQ